MAGKYAIETVFSLIDNVTRPLSNVNNEAKIVNRTLKNMYVGAEKATDRFMSKIKSLGGKLAGALGLAGIINIDKVIGFATSGITNAIAYQTAIAKVGVIADTARVPLQTMSKDILNLSTKMGIGAEKIADSVYNAISAGVDTGKAVSFAETASKAAIGGFTDTTTAIDGLTSVLNAYRLQAEQAVSISDQMIIAQKLGKTTFGDMAKTMGQVIPTAAALNVSTKELFSSVAALTANAIQTPQAIS